MPPRTNASTELQNSVLVERLFNWWCVNFSITFFFMARNKSVCCVRTCLQKGCFKWSVYTGFRNVGVLSLYPSKLVRA